MLWSDVLTRWENGIVLEYPKQLKGKFQWNTSVLRDNGRVEFKQSFRTNHTLPLTQNKKDFIEHFKKQPSGMKHVISFPNLSGDTMLVVPMPVRGKNYATLRDFIDSAHETQQQEFWKKVAEVARQFMTEKGRVWISVHGLGVEYTHVRISSSPKYYFDNDLKRG